MLDVNLNQVKKEVGKLKLGDESTPLFIRKSIKA